MPEFAYRAIDPDGREKRGRISATNDDAARERLGRVRLYVVEVELAEPRSASRNALKLPQRRKLNAKQLTLFTRQLASLVEVAPLEEAVRNLSRQQEREDVRAILGNVHNGLVEGLRFSDCLAREPASFPPLYRAMIAAGEGAGADHRQGTGQPCVVRCAGGRRAATRRGGPAGIARVALLQ